MYRNATRAGPSYGHRYTHNNEFHRSDIGLLHEEICRLSRQDKIGLSFGRHARGQTHKPTTLITLLRQLNRGGVKANNIRILTI